MILVTVHNFGKYPLSEVKLQEAAVKTFTDNGVISDAEASIAVVSGTKMQEYVDKYYGNDGEEHPVLSFNQNEIEGEFVAPPDDITHLGEIIVSYDYCVNESQKTDRSVEDIAIEMVEHGALHLMGVHHD